MPLVSTDNPTQPVNRPSVYPARPTFFAMKFIDRLIRGRVGLALGSDVLALLTVIVSREDKGHYDGPAKLFNDDLAAMAGLSLASMKRARDRAIEAGWLNYEQGARGRAATYFVIEPADYNDSGLLAQAEPESENIVAQAEPHSGVSGSLVAQAEPVSGDSGSLVAQNRMVREPPNTPIPQYLNTPSPTNGGADGVKPRKRRTPTDTEADPRFVRFWSEYPRKVSKPDAVKAFARINPDPVLLETILSALARQRQSHDWKKDEGRYIPYPASWLNRQRWEDSPTVQLGPASPHPTGLPAFTDNPPCEPMVRNLPRTAPEQR